MTQPPPGSPGPIDPQFAVSLSPEIERALSFQGYGTQPSIDGVHLAPLRKHEGENGWFMELFRLAEGEIRHVLPGVSFPLRQVSLAWADPGRLNAFHIHPKRPQDELWTVPRGRLLVQLVDCRAGSATEGHRQKIVLHGEAPAILHIPSGVAHGYQAGPDGALLLYGMNDQFDLADPNEGRLPWDHFGAELWDEDRG